jgi:hypothetical protein
MTTIPPKLAAGMLSRGNYKPLARATARKAGPRRHEQPVSVAGTLRAFVEACRTRPKTIVLMRK